MLVLTDVTQLRERVAWLRRRKKDHGRAEAHLLAAWAALYLDEHQAVARQLQADGAARTSTSRRTKRKEPSLRAAQHSKLLALQASGDSSASDAEDGSTASAAPRAVLAGSDQDNLSTSPGNVGHDDAPAPSSQHLASAAATPASKTPRRARKHKAADADEAEVPPRPPSALEQVA